MATALTLISCTVDGDPPAHTPDGGAPLPDDCSAPGTYCERTDEFGLGGFTSYGRGVSFADIDGDGWPDLFVVDCDSSGRSSQWGRTKVYRNLEGQGFATIDIGLHSYHLNAAWNGSFADYDNDGDPDLLISAGGFSNVSKLSLYENRMTTEARFVDVTESLGVPLDDLDGFSWWSSSWADYDGDGFLDVVATRLDARPLIFHNLGDGSFEEVGLDLGVVLPLSGAWDNTKNPVWIDIEGDGDPDLYVGGYVDAFYRNDGEMGFTQLPSPLESLGFPHFTFATAVDDFDQDGIDDLYFGRWYLQDMVAFGNGDGTFELLGEEIGLDALIGKPAVSESTPFENTMGLTVLDLHDDGYPDVFIGTGDPELTGRDILYCNDGTGSFERCTEVLFRPEDGHLQTRGHGMSTADVDRDGDSDVFLNLGGHPVWDTTHPDVDSRELNRFFLQDSGEQAQTVVLELEGTVSNRDAVGTRVTATGARTSYHTLRSSQAFQNQRSPEIIIPTGGAESVHLVIDWPSGARSETDVDLGDRVRIVEPRP